MSIFAVRLGIAFVVAAFCLGGRPAHAQSAAVTYWTPGWLGFGGNLNAGQGANTDGSFPGFGGSDAGGFSSTRYNFPNGWFIGNERGGMGLSMSGINQAGAFGSPYSEGVQFGYNFKNAPVTVYAGFDTLKYNSGLGSAFSPFDSTSSTVPGYGAHAGVEFKPTSNLSLSLGFGYTQQSGRIDSDTRSPSLSNASQFDLVGGRR
jgi:opacity protein-like surface antigen